MSDPKSAAGSEPQPDERRHGARWLNDALQNDAFVIATEEGDGYVGIWRCGAGDDAPALGIGEGIVEALEAAADKHPLPLARLDSPLPVPSLLARIAELERERDEARRLAEEWRANTWDAENGTRGRPNEDEGEAIWFPWEALSPATTEKEPEVIDLMEALKQSLAKKKAPNVPATTDEKEPKP